MNHDDDELLGVYDFPPGARVQMLMPDGSSRLVLANIADKELTVLDWRQMFAGLPDDMPVLVRGNGNIMSAPSVVTDWPMVITFKNVSHLEESQT